MGRKRLYNTEEERIEAQRRYCRESYHRNKEKTHDKYRLKALIRYYQNRLNNNIGDIEKINKKIEELNNELKQKLQKN